MAVAQSKPLSSLRVIWIHSLWLVFLLPQFPPSPHHSRTLHIHNICKQKSHHITPLLKTLNNFSTHSMERSKSYRVLWIPPWPVFSLPLSPLWAHLISLPLITVLQPHWAFPAGPCWTTAGRLFAFAASSTRLSLLPPQVSWLVLHFHQDLLKAPCPARPSPSKHRKPEFLTSQSHL